MSPNFRSCIAVLALIASLVGCATVQNRWSIVTSQNTREGYQRFIQEYPESEEAREARKRIEDLEYAFLATCRIGTQKAFEGFLTSYPPSHYASIARAYVEFLKETKADDFKSYKRFIDQHPDHPFVALAKVSMPVLWLKEKGGKVGVVVNVNGLTNKGLLGGGYGDAEKTRQRVWRTFERELQQEGIQAVLLDGLESGKIAEEGVKEVVIADYSESQPPPTSAPIAYRPTDSAIANALYWDSAQTLANLIYHPAIETVSITVKGLKDRIEYYSGFRSLSSSVGRVDTGEALRAISNYPSPAYAMIALKEARLVEADKKGVDEEFLKQLKSQ